MHGKRRNEQGMAFFLVTLLALVTTIMVGAYLSASLGKVGHVELEIAETSAFNAAESGLNMAVNELWSYYRQRPPATRVQALVPLDGSIDPNDQLRVAERPQGRSRFTAQVRAVNAVGTEYVDVEIVSRGWNDRASASLRAVVRFGHAPAAVFDHGYFINNFGWLWGAGITVNGSVRANGNFSLSNAVVNGDIFAAENGALLAAGSITGASRTKPVDWYWTHYGDSVRPTSPSAPPEDANGNGILDPGEDTNGNGKLDKFENVDGYDGASERSEKLAVVDMPYLGDLSIYRARAIENHGTISQGGVVVVDAVLGDGAGEEKNLILIGTKDNPIVLNGPVVVENDVVLRGVIQGQGTIYAGRNVHVIGDLTYADPPSWPKPMTDPQAVKQANGARDLVGLAAKGSIILGDYTVQGWKSVTRSYQKPPFTQAHEVDPTDASIGYVSHYDSEGRPIFDGDYTALDGGQKDGEPVGGNPDPAPVPRRYFESSYSDTLIHSLADPQVQHVDGVLYTNHLLSGKIGACTFNGALVSRDEAMIYSGSIDINYDIRVRQGAFEFLKAFLPEVPIHRVIFWGESH